MPITDNDINFSPGLASAPPSLPVSGAKYTSLGNALLKLKAKINEGVNIDPATGNIVVTGDLVVNGESTLTGDVAIAGNLDVDVDLGVTGEINTGGDATVGGDLSVTGAVNGLTLTANGVQTASQGTVGADVTEVTYGDGANFTTTLTITAALVDTVPAAGNLAIGCKIFEFTSEVMVVNVTHIDVGLSGPVAIQADTPEVGIGSIIASGAVGVLNGTAAFMDYLTEQTAADTNGTPTVATDIPTANTPMIIITGGSKDVFLNAAFNWTDAGAVSATGTVVINWIKIT